MPKSISKDNPKLIAITNVFAEHKLDPPVENVDWWNCHGDVVLKHNGCQKLAFSVGIRYLEPQWLVTGQNGLWAVMISGYLPDKPEDIIDATGESSPKNCTNQYPLAMADKRGKDRLTLRLLKLAKHGILSESEAESKEQELRERDDIIVNRETHIKDLEDQVEKLQNDLKKDKGSRVQEILDKTKRTDTKPAKPESSTAKWIDTGKKTPDKVEPKLIESTTERRYTREVWENWMKTAGLENAFTSVSQANSKLPPAKCVALLNLYIQQKAKNPHLDAKMLVSSMKNKFNVTSPRQLTSDQADELIRDLRGVA